MTIDIQPRATWNAAPPKTNPKPLTNFSSGWFVHWLGTPPAPGTSNEQTLRNTQRYHQQTKLWNDIAYSFAVGTSGQAFELRGWNIAGAHTEGHNNTSMAIVFLIGEGETPTPAMLNTAKEILTAGIDRGFPSTLIRPHNAVRVTDCPGPELTTWINEGLPTNGEPMPTTITLPANRGPVIHEMQQVLIDAGFLKGPSDGDPYDTTLHALHALKNDRQAALDLNTRANTEILRLRHLETVATQGPALLGIIQRLRAELATCETLLTSLKS
jgi:hypothetical protein